MFSPPGMDPVFQFPGEVPFKAANALLIDLEGLLTTTRATYEELAKTTTTLTLRAVPAMDIKWIYTLFTGVQHLTLERLAFRSSNWTGEVPSNLQTLRVLDCKIVKEVISSFFKANLVSVQFLRSYFTVPFQNYEDKSSSQDLIKFLPKTLRNLSTDAIVDDYTTLKELPLLEYIHSESGFPECSWANDVITTLICPRLCLSRQYGLGSIINPERFGWTEFKQLKHLRVTSSVSLQEKEWLQSSLPNLQTLDVHGYLPSVEENKILTTLNDDCLLHVLSFLKEPNWVILSLVHPTFSRLVYTHILPSQRINIEPYIFTLLHFTNCNEESAYAQLGKHIRHIFAVGCRTCEWMPHFTKLESMFMHEERSRFKLDDSWNWEHPNQIHFRRINHTLTSLTVYGLLCRSDLMALNRIRKFESQNAQDYNLLDFITQNKDHLESLKLDFEYFGYPMPKFSYDSEDEGEEEEDAPMSHNFVFCHLRNLKVLHLTHLEAAFVMELKAEDFPLLEELKVSFKEEYKPRHQDMLQSISRFRQLKSLSVWFNFDPLNEMPVEWLNPLQNLHTLGIVLEWSLLIKVLEQLPRVTTLEWWGTRFHELAGMPFELETDMRKFLEKKNRQINIKFKGKSCLVLP